MNEKMRQPRLLITLALCIATALPATSRVVPDPDKEQVPQLPQEQPKNFQANVVEELAAEQQQPIVQQAQPVNTNELASGMRKSDFHPIEPRNERVKIPNGHSAADGTFSLAQNPVCAEDIKRYCGPTEPNMNNLNVLECFQNIRENVNGMINQKCLHEVWKVKYNFTQSDAFLKAAESLCVGEFEHLPCLSARSSQKGEFLACVIEHRESISQYTCKQFLIKLETLVFSDFHLISGFTDACGKKIEEHQCGRIQSSPESSSQTDTIQCLTQFFDKLDAECQHQLLRVGELQGEDFHLDRALFFACRHDRETLCRGVLSGEGRVYSCLMRAKDDARMSVECKAEIFRREKLVRQDYEVSHGLAKMCRADIKEHKCRRESLSKHREVRLAQILLCLEQAINDGLPVSSQCQMEILEHRKALLEPLGLSPELIVDCEIDIHTVCTKDPRYMGRPTLECLMDLAAGSKHAFKKAQMISDKCQRRVESLLKEANAGEDWRIDPFVRQDCAPVVSSSCQNVHPGEGRVLQCLMSHLGTPAMTPDCEESLLRLMYFVARDFELDVPLYRNCKNDARKHCSANEQWAGGEHGSFNPEPGLVVLSCLYHVAIHSEDERKLEHRCEQEIRRVMHTRGKRVDLHPEIEDYCMAELAAFCSSNILPGQEILCLQDHMKKLGKGCKEKIMELTIDEDRHAEDNPYIMEHCAVVAKDFCGQYLNENAEEEALFECLVDAKPQIAEDHPKCYAAITHFELIALEDVKFTRKFEKACQEDISRFCYDQRQKNPDPKTNEEVIECLSEVTLEEALGEAEPGETLHPRCKKQLMNQLRREQENVEVNPRLRKMCNADIRQFCGDIEKDSGGKVVECLKEHFPKLSENCRNFLFRRDVVNVREDRGDFSLNEHCHGMIQKYKCQENTLECLKSVKDEPGFDHKCHVVVLRRMIEQSYDFRLSPALATACKLDIGKFCSQKLVGHEGKEPTVLEGEVMACLRNALSAKPHKLTDTCKAQVQGAVAEAAKDVRQNPHLMKVCKESIRKLCDGKSPSEVEECLKSALLSGDLSKNGIKDEKCKQEIVNIIAAEETDIHLDPILFGSCVVHLPVVCPNVPRGEGRQLKCLLGVVSSNPKSLSVDCREKLKSRQRMFAYADSHIKPPESLVELRDVVLHSPASNFFMLFMLGFVFFVFFGGLFFGRVTKRLRQEVKDK